MSTSPSSEFGGSMRVLPALALLVFYGTPNQRKVFFTLHIASILSCAGLMLVMIFSKLTRHSFLINYLLINCVLSIFSVLSTFSVSVEQLGDPTGTFALFQASAIMGGGYAAGLGDVLLALLMICKVSKPGSWLSNLSDTRTFSVLFNLIPWVLWAIISIMVAVLGSIHKDWVQYVSFWYNLSPFLYPWLYGMLAMFSLTILLDLIVACFLVIHSRRRSQLETHFSVDETSSTPFPPVNPVLGSRRFSGQQLPVTHQTAAERIEKINAKRWAALAGRVVALGMFFVCNAVMDGLCVQLKVNSAIVLQYEASRGVIISCILSSQSDILKLYGSFLLSIFPCFRRSSRHSSRRSQHDRRPSYASNVGPPLSYSDTSINLDPLAFSRPLGSLADLSESEAKDGLALYELKSLEEGVERGSVERERGDGKRRTVDHGGIQVRVEVQRHEEPTFSSW